MLDDHTSNKMEPGQPIRLRTVLMDALITDYRELKL